MSWRLARVPALLVLIGGCARTGLVTDPRVDPPVVRASDAGSVGVEAGATTRDGGVRPTTCRPACAVVGEASDVVRVSLPGADGSMNVFLGDFALVAGQPLVAWGAYTCCVGFGERRAAGGVLRLPDGEVLAGVGPTASTRVGIGPRVTGVDATVLVLDPLEGFRHARWLDANTGEVTRESTAPVRSDASTPPAIARLAAGGFAVLEGPDLQLVVLDEDLVELSRTPLGRTDVRHLQLTELPGGRRLASWRRLELLESLVVDAEGRSVEPVVELGVELPYDGYEYASAVSDGCRVELTTASSVVEVGEDGQIVARTRLPFPAFGALSTGEGLLVLERGDGRDGGPRVVLLERETGRELRELAAMDNSLGYASAGALGLGDGAAWFATSSYVTRGAVDYVPVACRD